MTVRKRIERCNCGAPCTLRVNSGRLEVYHVYVGDKKVAAKVKSKKPWKVGRL